MSQQHKNITLLVILGLLVLSITDTKIILTLWYWLVFVVLCEISLDHWHNSFFLLGLQALPALRNLRIALVPVSKDADNDVVV